MLSLFRPSTITARRRKMYGGVALWQPVTMFYYSLAAIICVTIALIFLAAGKYARKETAIGWLNPETGLSQLYPVRGGIVSETLVTQGAQVKQGQIIAKFKIDLSNSDGEIIPLQREKFQYRIKELDFQAIASSQKYAAEISRINSRRIAAM